MGLEQIRVELSLLPDAAQCVEYVMALPSELHGQVAILLDNWWCERNRVREGGNRRNQQELAWLIWR